MTGLVHAQLVGLRTLRSTYAVSVGLVALVALITGADVSANAGSPDHSSPAQLQEPFVTAVGILAAVGCSLFAAARVSGDYRFGTVTQRILASPHRVRLLAATFFTYGVLGLVLGSLALGAGLALALPLVAADGLSIGLSVEVIVAPLVAVILFTLIGTSVGVIVRNQAASLLVVGGAFVVEKLLAMFIGDAAAFLPYGLLNPLLGLEGATISRGLAATALLGFTVVLGALAAVLLSRRDVT